MKLTSLAALTLLPALALAQVPIRVPLEPQEAAIANPPRAPRDFGKINSRHRIIVAVLGDGVDYNHPFLLENFHFDLADGRATGLGHDYVGEDPWPSYRVFDTSRLSFDRQLPEDRKDIEETSSREKWEDDRADSISKFKCTVRAILKAQPGLAAFTPGERGFEAESNSASSTGVVGIIAGGRPAIGIIPYRVAPYARNQVESKEEGLGKRWIEIEHIKAAVEHAASRGAKIISLNALNFEARPDDTSTEASRNELRRFLNKKRAFADEYLALMNKHPDIVFVSKVSHSHGWTDNASLIQYPCGLPARNLVCAAPLNDRGVLEPNYKIPVNEDARVIFTQPTDADVLKPSDQCPELASLLEDALAAQDESGSAKRTAVGQLCSYEKASGTWTQEPLSRVAKSVADEALKSCTGRKNLITESTDLTKTERPGAQVTRHLAETWLAHPELASGAELLDFVFEKNARCSRTGALNLCSLETQAPDWESMELPRKAPKPANATPARRKLSGTRPWTSKK